MTTMPSTRPSHPASLRIHGPHGEGLELEASPSQDATNALTGALVGGLLVLGAVLVLGAAMNSEE